MSAASRPASHQRSHKLEHLEQTEKSEKKKERKNVQCQPALITPAGAFQTIKLPVGSKQGLAIYQSVQEGIFALSFTLDGSPLGNIFVDDSHLGDDNEDDHFVSLIQVLKLAKQYGLGCRLFTRVFSQPECVLLGNVVGIFGRRPDPKK